MAIVCTEFCLYKTIFSDIDKNVKENGRNLILGRMSIKKRKKIPHIMRQVLAAFRSGGATILEGDVMLVYVNYVFSILLT